MIDTFPPRLEPFAQLPVDSPEEALVAAQEELHRAAAAKHYLMIRPQSTTTDIDAATLAIEEARARVYEAKQAVINGAQPKDETEEPRDAHL